MKVSRKLRTVHGRPSERNSTQTRNLTQMKSKYTQRQISSHLPFKYSNHNEESPEHYQLTYKNTEELDASIDLETRIFFTDSEDKEYSTGANKKLIPRQKLQRRNAIRRKGTEKCSLNRW